MMHAENGMAIDVVAAQTVAAGTTDPIGHGLARKPIFEGEATNRVIRLAEAAGVPGLHRPPLGARGARAEVRAARDRGAEGVRRDLPAVPVPVARRPRATASRAPSSSARRRSARRTTGTSSGPASSRTTSRSSRPTTARSTSTARRSSARGDFRKIPNGLPGVEDRVDLLHDGGVVGGRITPRALGRDHLDGAGQAVRDVPAEGRDRGRLGRRPRRLRPEPHAHDLGDDPPHGRRLLVLRGPDGPGRVSDVVLSRGLGRRPRRRVHGREGRRPVHQARRRRTTPG